MSDVSLQTADSAKRCGLMSAPPLLTMPTMVSRLPKFGSKPKSSTLSTASSTNTRLTNGFYHHPGPAGVNGSSSYTAPTPVKQNGFIRVPTKWRKENEEEGGAIGIRSAINNNNHQLNLQGKTAISSTGKGGASVSPRLHHLRRRPAPVTSCLQNGVKWNKTGSKWCFWIYCFKRNKSTLMGVSGSGSGSRPRIGSLRQPGFSRPGSGTGPGSSVPVPVPVIKETSSESISLQRQPGKSYDPANAKRSFPFSSPSSCPPALVPPPSPAASAIGCHPALIKQSRPLRVTTANGSGPEVNRGPTARSNSVETPSTTENSPESPPEAPERGLSAAMVAQREVSILGETLEDMSLSSNSSG
ncbi:hypothetical protein F7725_013783 [Dissostichus mawsoni]|uniref:Uncharacterized protein n=1 Tax=Dissostichus mawsoni TaxID=36200 RepID=A0A7J5YUC8_DISMA|nr:hypothetical protein F7725_013783 [Dissostichus mawsoni]